MDFEIIDDSKTITVYQEGYSRIIKKNCHCKSNARRKEKRHTLLNRPLKFKLNITISHILASGCCIPEYLHRKAYMFRAQQERKPPS